MQTTSLAPGKGATGTSRGFTLIELLVVIAIIAILAAILFPVFAQAREKARSVSCLSNQKQIALGIVQYVQDYDEVFPQGWGYDAVDTPQGWLAGYTHDVPYDWEVAADSFPLFKEAMKTLWANSIQAYIHNYDVYACPSSAEYKDARFLIGDYSPTNLRKKYADISYSFNGLLSGYPLAGVATPSGLIMLGEWYGKVKIAGSLLTVPGMACDDPNSPCVYQPASFDSQGNATCVKGNGGISSFYSWGPVVTTPAGTEPAATLATERIHTGGVNTAFADGHVKYRRVGAQTLPNLTDSHTDPFAYYTADGIADVTYYDGCHATLFRPNINYR